VPTPPVDPAAAFLAARESAFVAPLPGTAILEADGADAAAFLQGQLSSDVAALAPRAAQWSTYNSAKGRMLATLVLWRPAAGPAFRIALAADLAAAIRKRLSMFVLRSKVVLGAPGLVAWGVGGPRAADAVRAALGVEPATLRAIGVDGAEAIALPDGRVLVVASPDAADGLATRLGSIATPADESAWRWLAIRAGVAEVRLATQERHVAQTANWDANGGLSFTKGCFPGQEIVARTQHLGILKERAHPFNVDAPPPPAGTPVYSSAFGEQACGSVVDAVAMPGGGSDLLAIVQTKAIDAGDARLGAPDGPPLRRLPLPYELPSSVPKRVRL
jgi:hypothetical protein